MNLSLVYPTTTNFIRCDPGACPLTPWESIQNFTLAHGALTVYSGPILFLLLFLAGVYFKKPVLKYISLALLVVTVLLAVVRFYDYSTNSL